MPPNAPAPGGISRGPADCLTYEVTVEVPERHRSRFEEWFPSVALDWATQPEVRSFRAFRGADVEAHLLRFQFAFLDEADWERFVRRSAHRERLAHLETVSTSVRTSLWAPAVVSLTGDGDAVLARGNEARDADGSVPESRSRAPLSSGR